MALIADEVGYGWRSASQWLPIRSATADCSQPGRSALPLRSSKNIERGYCNDGVSSILDGIENTARQLALSAKEIPINGNNFYI